MVSLLKKVEVLSDYSPIRLENSPSNHLKQIREIAFYFFPKNHMEASSVLKERQICGWLEVINARPIRLATRVGRVVRSSFLGKLEQERALHCLQNCQEKFTECFQQYYLNIKN